MVREANAIDFWRGFALVTIFINHIPGIYFERFTRRNISISDSAELFVFLAGWALRLLYNHLAVTQGVRYVLLRIASRALTIYAAHLMLICLAIAMLATAAYFYDNPLFLEWYNAAGVFYDPMRAHMGLVALTYQLGYFDILPLYVVLMAGVAPLTVILHGYVPRLLLPIAICLYVIIMVWQISLPTWPTDGHWFFNLLAWQLVFVLGFVLAGDGGLEKTKPTNKKLRAKDRPVANGFASDQEFDRLLAAWFGNIARVLIPGGGFYIWGGYANCANYPPVLKAMELYFSQAVIWIKEHPVLTRKDFMGNHEWCFYGWKEGAAHRFFGPNNVPDTWSIKKVNPQSMVHLTEKPVELARRAIEYSSRPGENVLDLFGGSGSTLIGAEMTGRRAYLMDLDPLYCDVIVQRWEKFTGRKAERLPAKGVAEEKAATRKKVAAGSGA